MKTRHYYFLLLLSFFLNEKINLIAQTCDTWSMPQTITNGTSDNRNALLVKRFDGPWSFYLFWERSYESGLTEIVYMNYYEMGNPQVIVSGDGYNVSNPQAIISGWGIPSDTYGCFFYETDQSGNGDIYYCLWTIDGFSSPYPFANTMANESHLRVSQGGGFVWQKDDKIQYSRRFYDETGLLSFTPFQVIDSGLCFNPIINYIYSDAQEEFIVWQKGNPDSSEVWYSNWDWDLNEWNQPIKLFNIGNYSNLRFSQSFYFYQNPILILDYKDSLGNFYILGYDFYSQAEFKSEFYQSEAFQPDYYTIEPFNQDFWNAGYLSFKNKLENDNSDIFTSDQGLLSPVITEYCCLDRDTTIEVHPQFYQGVEGGDCYNLDCIWESFRNGYWHLYSSNTLIVTGDIQENKHMNNLNIFSVIPNPVKSISKLKYPETVYGLFDFQILNANGIVVQSKSGIPLESIFITTDNISPGMYLIRLFSLSENQSYTIKFLVN